MSKGSRFIPHHLLGLMSAAERAKHGPAGVTSKEAQEKWAAGREREMHDLFAKDMQRRGVMTITSTYGRKATIRKGWPDFTLLKDGRGCCVEFKAEGGKLSDDQVECIAELEASGVPVLVAYHLQAAIDFVKECLTQRRGDAEGGEG